MNLRDADLATLAMMKAGLTLDHRDGTLLLDDAEELMFFCQRRPKMDPSATDENGPPPA